jgi:3'(2'), 5'-bisphosphate nucleotidase
MEERVIREVEELLRKAGDIILDVYYSGKFETIRKSDLSPVTKADHLSSKTINHGLKILFPGIPVIDEENPIPAFQDRKDRSHFFLLDPLDGTREFINRNGEFCINLALMENNRPAASWIYQPVGRRGWYCIKGSGLREFGGRLAATAQVPAEDNRLRLITSRSHTPEKGYEFFDKISKRYDLEIVRLGSALKQVEVALGFSGLYVRGSGCSEWDTAAGHLMVEENGGTVLQWDMASSLAYNKPGLTNPPFMMISNHWQTVEFKEFISSILPQGK